MGMADDLLSAYSAADPVFHRGDARAGRASTSRDPRAARRLHHGSGRRGAGRSPPAWAAKSRCLRQTISQAATCRALTPSSPACAPTTSAPTCAPTSSALLEYVEDGGTLVVQYNRWTVGAETAMSGPASARGPSPSQPASRVTVEEAPVTFPHPAIPLLHTPNKITARDFDGWVQERGLYFATRVGPALPGRCSTRTTPARSRLTAARSDTRYGKASTSSPRCPGSANCPPACPARSASSPTCSAPGRRCQR